MSSKGPGGPSGYHPFASPRSRWTKEPIYAPRLLARRLEKRILGKRILPEDCADQILARSRLLSRL